MLEQIVAEKEMSQSRSTHSLSTLLRKYRINGNSLCPELLDQSKSNVIYRQWEDLERVETKPRQGSTHSSLMMDKRRSKSSERLCQRGDATSNFQPDVWKRTTRQGRAQVQWNSGARRLKTMKTIREGSAGWWWGLKFRVGASRFGMRVKHVCCACWGFPGI